MVTATPARPSPTPVPALKMCIRDSYRAIALVAGLAVGNLVLVNGTILAGLAQTDDDSLGLLLLPIVVGIGLILYGYRQFRYGEEVEDKPHEFQKARCV